MPKAKNYTEAEMIAAIHKSNGSVKNLSKVLGCDWHTADKYLKELDLIRQLQDQERKILDDYVNEIHTIAFDHEVDARIRLDAIKFTLARRANWNERQEHSITSDEPLFVVRADQTKEHQARVKDFEKKMKNGLSNH